MKCCQLPTGLSQLLIAFTLLPFFSCQSTSTTNDPDGYYVASNMTFLFTVAGVGTVSGAVRKYGVTIEFFDFQLIAKDDLTQVSVDDCGQFTMETTGQLCRFDDSVGFYWMMCPWEADWSKKPVAFCTYTSALPTTSATTAATPSSKNNTMPITIAISALILCAIIFIAVFMFLRYRKKRSQLEELELKMEQERSSVSGRLHATVNSVGKRYSSFRAETDEWEIDRRCIDVEYSRHLGHGAFGSVYLGKLIDVDGAGKGAHRVLEISMLRMASKSVAIKMLAVNLVGCVTASMPRLLIMEYCENGDLLKFMIKRREYMIELQSQEHSKSDEDDDMIITSRQQLMFAVQIVYGLEFLSQKGFVHRDVAARNILVDERKACRIGDFGLCRHMDQAHDIYLSKGGRLPLKWMPPEAIKDYEFSNKSDVWSFGVLLFEIVTLGGTPYPDWAAQEVLQRICCGERMARPENCSDEMYTLMTDCWAAVPDKRPDFSEIRERIAILLEDLTMDDFYLRLDASKDYYQPTQANGLNHAFEEKVEEDLNFEEAADC